MGPNSAMRKCNSMEEASQASGIIVGMTRNGTENSEWFATCPLPCKKTTYDLNVKDFHANSWTDPFNKTGLINVSSVTLLSLFYETLSTEEMVETLMYDVGSFLAAAGGNLGLFLGFSCLSMTVSFIQFCKNRFYRKNRCG